MCSIHTCKRFGQEQNITLSVNPYQTKKYNLESTIEVTKHAFKSGFVCVCAHATFFFPIQALDVQRKLNCCTGILLESFDQLKTVASNKDGLLYGVPVSIKENIEYEVASLLSCVHLLLNGSCTTENVPLVHLELSVTLCFC